MSHALSVINSKLKTSNNLFLNNFRAIKSIIIKMSETHKKNFVYSAKRLKYFFNHIKEGDLELVDQRAQVQ